MAGEGPLPNLSILDVMLAIGVFFVLKMLIGRQTIWRWKAARKMRSGWGDRWWGMWFGIARGPGGSLYLAESMFGGHPLG